MSCAHISKAEYPDPQICGGYFDLEDIKDVLFQVENPDLRLIKVRRRPSCKAFLSGVLTATVDCVTTGPGRTHDGRRRSARGQGLDLRTDSE